MKSITIRGIDELLHKKLENLSKTENISLNKTILSLLKKALGLDGKIKYPIYNDLDHLAGTWTEEDEKEFREATSRFSKIDEDIWQ